MKYANNHAAALRGQHSYNRKQILFLTGLSCEQLTNMQAFILSEWLSYFFPACNPDALMQGKAIWNWWVYVWNELDEQALPILYDISANPVNRFAYYRSHVQLIFNINYNPTAKAIIADFKSLAEDFEREAKAIPTPHTSTV